MTDERKERYRQIKDEITDIEHAMDELHKVEASILADIDAVEREAKERNLPELRQQLLSAFTRLIAAGSLLAQSAVDLKVPPTVFEPVLQPHELPTKKSDEERKKAS